MSSDEQSTNDEDDDVEEISNQRLHQSTNQHHDQSASQQHEQSTSQEVANLSHNLRNDLQLQNRQLSVGDVMAFGGNVNVDNSNVNNFQNFDHVENLTVNITQSIVGPRQNIQVTNSTIDNNATTSNSATPTAGAEVFDEQEFRNHFVRMEFCYKDISLTERKITEEMYDNMPYLVETTYQHLSNRSREEITQEGTTKLSQAFPIEGERAKKRKVAITGPAGSGKSVYALTLKSYYTKQGFFVFSLDFFSMSFSNAAMSFPEVLINFSCPDFPFDSPKTFAVWLCKNDHKAVFVIDGLDQAPHIIKPNVTARNIQSSASVGEWMSALLGGKIMKKAKIIYTSRPISVANLVPLQQPDQILCLNGFSDQSIEGVIRTYNNEHVDEITKFIDDKGPAVIRFSRNPFIISLISLSYGSQLAHITHDTTLTEIYRIGLHQLSSSIRRLRGENENTDQNQQTEDLIDKFYYEMFNVNKHISFTEEDVTNRNLSVKQLENFSLVGVTSNQLSLVNELKERSITPQHQSVSEYHVSRHMVKVMDVERFRTVVENHMFKLNDQDRWSMIRKFVAGQINTGKIEERKRKIFLKKFITELHGYVTGNLVDKIDGNLQTFSVLGMLQSSLFNDLTEMNKETEVIRKSFTGVPDLHLSVELKDTSSIFGLIYFLRQINPQLYLLNIVFRDDITVLHFRQLTEAIKALSKNIGEIHIPNIQVHHENMEDFHEIIHKTDRMLFLRSKIDFHVDEIENIKQNLQSQIDRFHFKRTYIDLLHQNRRHLIRHSMYTSMTSSIVLPSLYGRSTINLMMCRRSENFEQIENIANLHVWQFFISQQDEIEILIKFLIKVKPKYLGKIDIYPTSDVNWNLIRMFCNKITIHPYKVQLLGLFNLRSSEIGINHVVNLVRNVDEYLEIKYMDEIDENEVDRWKSQLESVQHLMPQDLKFGIHFNNFVITRLFPSYTIQVTITD